jgi:hypothetical protein
MPLLSNWRSNLAARLLVLGVAAGLALTHGLAVAADQSQHAVAPGLKESTGFYAANCDRPGDREEADLCAQMRLAKAAESVVALADRQTKLSYMELGALLLTLLALSVAAVAAMRALRIARDTARLQLRAYVFPVYAHIRDVRASRPNFVIDIKNFGQTPAYGLRMKTALQSGSYPLDRELVPDVQSSIATAQLAPQAALFDDIALNHSLSENEISTLAEGSAAIYLFGEIEYFDIYKARRWTTFRMLLGGPDGVPAHGRLGYHEQGNDADRE